MDPTDNLFVRNFLNFGQFDLFVPEHSLRKRKTSLNRLIKLVAAFNSAKCILINLAAFIGYPELKLYAIELYMFDTNQQKLVDVGISIACLGFYVGFTYWSTLDKKPSSLEPFRFLLVPAPNDLHLYRQRYHLDQRSSVKFIKFYRLARLFLLLIIADYCLFCFATVSKCLYESFHFLSLSYFLSVSLPLGVITLVAWWLLFIFLLPKFILVILSTKFLILQLKSLDTLIINRFLRPSRTTISDPIKLRKLKTSIFKVLRRLNEFCRQFEKINATLDASLSGIMLGYYICFSVFPYFLIFSEMTPEMRLLVCALSLVDYLFCCSFFFCNERLKRQVGYLELPLVINRIVNVVFFRSNRWKTPYTSCNPSSSQHLPKYRLTTFLRWTASIKLASLWPVSEFGTASNQQWRWATWKIESKVLIQNRLSSFENQFLIKRTSFLP